MRAVDWVAVIGAVILIAAWVVVQILAARRWADLIAVLDRIAWLLETDPADDDTEPPTQLRGPDQSG